MSRHKRWAIAEVLSHSPKADTVKATTEAKASEPESTSEEASS
jgi:hypothetical protein